MTTISYKHWIAKRDDDNIHWLCLDKQKSTTNVLSSDVVNELEQELSLLKDNLPLGVIFYSAKENGFIAGADVNEFTGFATEQDALKMIQRGHDIMNAIDLLQCPTVAMINGFCLGGGLELALACNYRIAEDDPKTRIGLPEVRLGIHPGFGGSYRLINQIGPIAAMTAMLTGKSYSASAAAKIGIIDFAVPKRHLIRAATNIINTPPKNTNNKPFWHKIINHKFSRVWMAKIFIKNVAKKAPRAHYPAPYALIDLWVKYFDDPSTMLSEEAISVSQLIVSKTAQNLVRVFLLQEQLKSLGSVKSYQATHVHVIGGGVMGGDIAAWCALKGFNVTIQDQSHETLARVIKRAYSLYKKRLKKPILIKSAMDRLIPDFRGNSLHRADIIIEAIFEDITAKQNLFKSIEPIIKKDALLATNTSSIPLETIATVLKQPDRLVGLHFFNPVAMMPLVEVVHTNSTEQHVLQKAAAFAKKIDRLPLPVKSTPGFLVNRILMPYLMEAVLMLDENIPPLVIDKAAVGFGMPMGPIELADTVGLDICLHVAENLSETMNISIPQRLQKLVAKKMLGKKTGQGFYQFKKGKPVKTVTEKGYKPPVDIRDRLILTLINEAMSCLRDGVAENSDMIDAGVIFGTGFAPFRGGPLHYKDYRGQEQLLHKLENLQHTYGERFKPDEIWKTEIE